MPNNIIRQDYGTVGTDVQTQMLIAPVLAEMKADRQFAVGDQFIVDSVLYKITQAISVIGTPLVVDSNCEVSDTIIQQLRNLLDYQDITGVNGAISDALRIFSNGICIKTYDFVVPAGTYNATVPIGSYYYVSLGYFTNDDFVKAYKGITSDDAATVLLPAILTSGEVWLMRYIKDSNNNWHLTSMSLRSSTSGGQVTLNSRSIVHPTLDFNLCAYKLF